MSRSYVVRVHYEDADDDPKGYSLLYGPFRSYIRALDFAARIGRGSGLNLNNASGWAGTDGKDKYAFVEVRSVMPADTWHVKDSIRRLLGWFLPEKEETE